MRPTPPLMTDFVLSPPSAAALEIEELRAVLASLAATDLGRQRLLTLAPLVAPVALAERRQRFTEASLLAAERRLVGSFDFPLGDLLHELGSGRPSAVGTALIHLADLLRETADARQRILEAVPPLAALSLPARALPDLGELARKIHRSLDRRGEVREDASPKLGTLRERIRGLRDGLYGELRKVVERERENLSEETIPMRGGRLVLLLSAGARGRSPGLVHGRSGTGRSFYFEPLEVVESNNRLQQAVDDEEAERNRILEELLAEARRQAGEITTHADFLAELDLLQAASRFATLTGSHLAEIAPPGELRLVAARHPLLDPALAPLRRDSLGTAGHEGAIVPLDLELGDTRRALVITGPNAGGKTVVLKTLGLLCLAHQCGLPVPAEPGTRLPVFARIVATIGDEQDLLADRSTFSGRLLRLREAWEEASPESLVLLDELGSGTDPEEGAALAIALLEGLLERQGLTLITTHLIGLAAAALEREGARCAAMELDPATGQPTYRLVPGSPGGSEALGLARRLQLPAAWLDRAEALLGSEHQDLRRMLAELEATRQELASERQRMAHEASQLELSRARFDRERAALEAERRVVGRRLKSELDAFRLETRKKLRDEVERLKEELLGGRRKGLEAQAEERLFEAAPDLLPAEHEPEAPVRAGGTVRHRSLGWEGSVEKISGERVDVLVRGKRVRCGIAELVGLAADEPRSSSKTSAQHPPRAGEAQASGDLQTAAKPEINLIGQRVEPALDQLDDYLDQALRSSVPEVRVIHGHGTGRLRDAIRQHLRSHPAVAGSRPGAANEGGNGATVITLAGHTG